MLSPNGLDQRQHCKVSHQPATGAIASQAFTASPTYISAGPPPIYTHTASISSASARVQSSLCRALTLSPFVIIASCDVEGAMDASPRGGEPGFVKAIGDGTLMIPDSPGNNRLDTLENIVQTGRIGLLFLLPGVDESLRVNGRAVLSTADAELDLCAVPKRRPKLVIRVTVEAAYLHCAKALMRSSLWDASRHINRQTMPSMGEMLKDQIGGDIPAETQAEMLVRYAVDL